MDSPILLKEREKNLVFNRGGKKFFGGGLQSQGIEKA